MALSNAATIRGIAPLNYAKFVFPNDPATQPSPAQSAATAAASPILRRARWLATGLGDAAAAFCAARSFITGKDRTLLVAITPALATKPKPPSTAPDKATEMSSELWVFTSRDISDMASDAVLCHVAAVFDIVETGTWRGERYCAVVTPLVCALRDAVHHSFQTRVEGLSLGPEHVYVPSSNLVYRLRLALGHDASVSVNMSILAPPRGMRPVELADLDCEKPRDVLIAPLAIRARLQPKRRAGEALAASVLDRWADASLLCSSRRDEAVVFVNVAHSQSGTENEGVSFPLPLKCLLLMHEETAACKLSNDVVDDDTDTAAATPAGRKLTAKAAGKKRKVIVPLETVPVVKRNVVQRLWHSLKRPRSPSADVEALERVAKKELSEIPTPSTPVSAADVHMDPVVDDESRKLDVNLIDRAIAAAVSTKGLPPILHHPLAPQSRHLGYYDTDIVRRGAAEGGTVDQSSKIAGGQAAVTNNATALIDGDRGDVNEVALNTVSVDPLSGDIDTLRDGEHASLKNGSEAGRGFDMDELGGFDDDVTQFFGGADVTPSAPNATSPAVERDGAVESRQVLGVEDLSSSPTAMDLDVGPNVVRACNGSAKTQTVGQPKASGRSLIGTTVKASGPEPEPDIASAWFAMLDAPNDIERPPTPERTEQVEAFLEQDLAKRLRVRSRVDTSPDRRATKKRAVPTNSILPGASVFAARDVYIPRRAMLCFKKLKAPLSSSESDSDSCTADDIGYSSDSIAESDTKEDGKTANTSADGESAFITGDAALASSNSNSRCSVAVRRAIFAASTVAVDCASACYMVLSAEPDWDFDMASPWLAGVSSIARVPSFPNPVENHLVDADTHSTDSGSAVARGKVERNERQRGQKDSAALLSLLQMQMIGAPEVQLLPANGLQRLRVEESEREVAKGNSGLSGNLGAVVDDVSSALRLSPASPALVRRALLGFPDIIQSGRLLECEGNDDMDTSGGGGGQRAGMLSVSDPLLLEDSAKAKVPRVCVGYDGGWVETGCGVLPLWEKSGLEPYASTKSVQYAALAPKELADDVRNFFRDVSAAYEECSLGRHSPMPFDSLSLIANSVPVPSRCCPLTQPDDDVVTTAESRMVQQYHLAATGLATKLTAVARDARKSDAIGPNFVIYIVSPFPRHRRAAIAALFQAVTPLVSCIPNTVVSSGQSPLIPPGLMSSPWRHASSALPIDLLAQPSAQPQPPQIGMASSNGPANTALLAQSVNGVALGLTVRVLPWEAVERYPLDQSTCSHPSFNTLRPQLVKSVAFAVYGSLRSRRLRRTMQDSDALVVTHTGEASELLSPMTPDIAVGGSPSSGTAAPPSPSPAHSGDIVGPASMSLSNADQSLSSFLYDPAFVLAGAGERMSQTGSAGLAAFHLSYTVVEDHSKCIFAWTDSRGETLDVGVMPVDKMASGGPFSKMFGAMWKRGQQWWVSYVDQTCVTIAKVGQAMSAGEREDWQSVVQACISSNNAKAEFPDDRIEARLRFPKVESLSSTENPIDPEIVDVLRDAATPATPASMPAAPASISTGSGQASIEGKVGAESGVDASLSTLRSVTLMTIVETNFPDLATSEATKEMSFVTETAGGCEAKAIMIIDVDQGKSTRQVELSMLAHFGVSEVENQPSCDWDGQDAASILGHVSANFDALRAAASPPCWPRQSWLSPFPIHVDIVWNLRRLICSFSGSKV